MEDGWLQDDRYKDELQGHCLLWLGVVVLVCWCTLMALLRVAVDGQWSLAVGQVQGLDKCWVL